MSAEEEATPRRRSGDPPWVIRLFAVVGLLGVVAVIALAAMVMGFDGNYEPPRVAGAENPEVVFSLGQAEPIDGTELVSVEVAASRGRGGSYSGSRDDVRNLLLIDRRSGASRKLLPDNRRRIARSRFLPAMAEPPENVDVELMAGQRKASSAPAAYYVLTVENAETPKLHDVLVGTLESGRQGYVMQGLDGVDHLWMHSPTQIGMIVREKLGLYYKLVDIPTLKVVASRRIPID